MNLSVCCANTTGRPVSTSISWSDFHSWENKVLSTFHSESPLTSRPVLWYCSIRELRGNRLSCLIFPGLSDTVDAYTSGIPFGASRDQIHHRFRLCCDFFFTWIFLRSFWHYFRTICRTEMADVKQTQKMIPFITCEVSLGQCVCELVLGVNTFDLDFGVQINSIEQLFKSNSVGSGNMSHCRASSLHDHLDHCFVVFKHIQQSSWWESLTFEGKNYANHWSLSEIACVCELCEGNQPFSPFYHDSDSCSQELQRSDPINQVRECNPTSILHPKKWFPILLNCAKLNFDPHIQLIGTNVWLPKTHNDLSEVDFESSRYSAKSDSWNSPSLHCMIVLPKKQNCLYSHVWWLLDIKRLNRLSQTLGPFCNRPCKFNHWR